MLRFICYVFGRIKVSNIAPAVSDIWTKNILFTKKIIAYCPKKARNNAYLLDIIRLIEKSC